MGLYHSACTHRSMFQVASRSLACSKVTEELDKKAPASLAHDPIAVFAHVPG